NTALFDKPLPPDVYFKLRFAPTDASVSAAVVRVWPVAVRACDQVNGDFASLAGKKQFHELFMLRGTGDDKAFVARIPPLQVGQRFCVSIQAYTPLSGELLDDFSKDIADRVASKLTPAAGTNGSVANPAASKDVVRDTIAEQLAVQLKARFGSQAPDVSAAAGRVAEMVDVKLITAYTGAVATYNATAAKLKATPADKLPPAAEVDKKVGELKASIVATRTALTDALESKLKDDSVKASFTAERIVYGGARAGEGETASAANYAAIDTGVVAAFPLGYAGGNGDPWALPYVGLNLYFRPVDRTIPLSELVEQGWQRVSLTIGRTLSSPTLPNRTITDFGFGFPVVAVGWRVSQFIRATTGTVFYQSNNPNPTSERTLFGVAPFVGLALDGDVIAIGQGKLFAPK
ncbi:MAG TPA: hypothetical protein VNG33_18610, partial [Polyangiaceae bacterium]|nr:hypothetical protein [Polyangiaceae bacterium]